MSDNLLTKKIKELKLLFIFTVSQGNQITPKSKDDNNTMVGFKLSTGTSSRNMINFPSKIQHS